MDEVKSAIENAIQTLGFCRNGIRWLCSNHPDLANECDYQMIGEINDTIGQLEDSLKLLEVK